MKHAKLVAAVAAGIAVLTVAVAAFARTPADEPKATASAFPSGITATVPPGGNASVTSPTLPADAKQATITLKPAKSEDEELFDDLQAVLAETPSKTARVLICVALAFSGDEHAPVDFSEEDETIAALFLHACVRMAITLGSAGSTDASAAQSGLCARRRTAADARITRTGSGFRMQVEGTTRKPGRRSRVVVKCRNRGTGIRLKLRPRKRGRKLRKVIGRTVGIGLISPSDANRGVKVRTTFGAK